MVDWGAGDVMGGERVFKTAVLNDLEILLRGFAYNLDIYMQMRFSFLNKFVYCIEIRRSVFRAKL